MEFNPQRPLAMGELEWHYVGADLAERPAEPQTRGEWRLNPEWVAAADQAAGLISHQPWEPLTWPPPNAPSLADLANPSKAARRFSPEFAALLRKRFESFTALSPEARTELFRRAGAAEARLIAYNIFAAMRPGVHLKHEPLAE